MLDIDIICKNSFVYNLRNFYYKEQPILFLNQDYKSGYTECLWSIVSLVIY